MTRTHILSLFFSCFSFAYLFGQDLPYASDRVLALVRKEVSLSISASDLQFKSKDNEAWLKSLGVRKQESLAPHLMKRGASVPIMITFQQEVDIPSMIRVLQASGLYAYVEPDYKGSAAGQQGVVPNDPLFSRQWGLVNDGTFDAKSVVDADIDMEEAWEITQGDSSIIIAILDSGINPDHPEFEGRLWNNSSEIPDNEIDDDGNGYVDDTWGWDFVKLGANDTEDNDPKDDNGHGTNVSSILAATGDNGIGYAGIDWHGKIMTGKIVGADNSGFYSWWTKAIYYAVDHGADVINMSVGGSSFSQSMHRAVQYAYDRNVPIAVSMMNVNNAVPYYPAAYEETIAVGATDTDNRRVSPFFWSNTSGSNYGDHIDLVAPGNFMYGLAYNSVFNYNSYWGGTSQATPLVTGVMSLMKGLEPSLSIERIRDLLTEGAVDLVGDPFEDTEGWDRYHGAGLLNAYNSLNLLTAVSTSLPNGLSPAHITLFPNPGKGIYSLSTALGLQDWRLSVMDIQGRRIAHWENIPVTATFRLEAKTGIYLVMLIHKTSNQRLLKSLYHWE